MARAFPHVRRPMIVVHLSSNDAHLEAIQALAPVHASQSWHEPLPDQTRVLVRFLGRVEDLQRRVPRTVSGWRPHQVLVAPLTVPFARAFVARAESPSESVIWEPEMPAALVREVRRRVEWPGERVLRQLLLACDTPFLRAVVTRVLAHTPPPRAVRSLCDDLGVPESTLRYHWSRQFPGVSLYELIRWSDLLSSVAPHTGLTARELGLDDRTLDRAAVRFLGKSYDDVRGLPELLTVEFEAWAQATILKLG